MGQVFDEIGKILRIARRREIARYKVNPVGEIDPLSLQGRFIEFAVMCVIVPLFLAVESAIHVWDAAKRF